MYRTTPIASSVWVTTPTHRLGPRWRTFAPCCVPFPPLATRPEVVLGPAWANVAYRPAVPQQVGTWRRTEKTLGRGNSSRPSYSFFRLSDFFEVRCNGSCRQKRQTGQQRGGEALNGFHRDQRPGYDLQPSSCAGRDEPMHRLVRRRSENARDNTWCECGGWLRGPPGTPLSNFRYGASRCDVRSPRPQWNRTVARSCHLTAYSVGSIRQPDGDLLVLT